MLEGIILILFRFSVGILIFIWHTDTFMIVNNIIFSFTPLLSLSRKASNSVVVLCCCGVRNLSQFSLNKVCYLTSTSLSPGRYGFASVFTVCYIKHISVSKSNVNNHFPWIKDHFYLLHICLKGNSKVPDESWWVKMLQRRKSI